MNRNININGIKHSSRIGAYIFCKQRATGNLPVDTRRAPKDTERSHNNAR